MGIMNTHFGASFIKNKPKKKIGLIINNGVITTDKIKDSSITTNKIVDNAVTTNKVDNNAITENKIASSAVTTPKIRDNSITTSKIFDESITSEKIAYGSVTGDKIAIYTISTDKYIPGSVTTTVLCDSAVSEEKIMNNAVTERKIKDGSITNSKIHDTSITNNKIADGAIITPVIANKAVTEAKLADNAVSGRVLQEGSINKEHLSDSCFSDILNNLLNSAEVTKAIKSYVMDIFKSEGTIIKVNIRSDNPENDDDPNNPKVSDFDFGAVKEKFDNGMNITLQYQYSNEDMLGFSRRDINDNLIVYAMDNYALSAFKGPNHQNYYFIIYTISAFNATKEITLTRKYNEDNNGTYTDWKVKVKNINLTDLAYE